VTDADVAAVVVGRGRVARAAHRRRPPTQQRRLPRRIVQRHRADAGTTAGREEPRAASRSAIAPSAVGARRDRAELETSAGGIVYRMQDGEALFLLIRDSYRNWGFPKGHLEEGEQPQDAAVREVEEETGLGELRVDGAIETIDWFFRFRGKLVHKVCHFYLMRTRHARTNPQREEGITACRWARFEDATRLISYANARAVLVRAHEMVIAEESRRGG
jgi:8-oxo-dGTP pyrophosphatase MutT (NUDIX family)